MIINQGVVMRADMFKVLIGRPRHGSRYFSALRNHYRAAKKIRLDEDLEVCDEFSARMLPMLSRRAGYDYKEFSDRIQPLHRYLVSQLGRSWNDIWSEICAGNDVDCKLKWHLRLHIDLEVKKSCYRDADGHYWANDSGPCRPLGPRDIFVDPETGVLRRLDSPGRGAGT